MSEPFSEPESDPIHAPTQGLDTRREWGLTPSRRVVAIAEIVLCSSVPTQVAIGVLLGAVKRLRPSGGKVGIVCTDAHIRRIFEITLLDRVFSLHTSLDAARAVGSGNNA